MSGLPGDSDWKEFEEAGYNSVIKYAIGAWGEAGKKLAGAYTLACARLKHVEEARAVVDEVRSKDRKIADLEQKVSELQKLSEGFERSSKLMRRKFAKPRVESLILKTISMWSRRNLPPVNLMMMLILSLGNLRLMGTSSGKSLLQKFIDLGWLLRS